LRDETAGKDDVLGALVKLVKDTEITHDDFKHMHVVSMFPTNFATV